MKEYTTENIRNVALLAHSGAGKTSLVQAMLYTAGAVDRLNKVEDGNTVSDYDPDEISRGTSINVTPAHAEWKDLKINLIDTPGYADFIGEMIAAIRVTDTALIVLNAQAGVEGGSERVWEECETAAVPRAFFVNRIDKENASFNSSLESARKIFGDRVIPFQLPVGEGPEFKGVVDIMSGKAYMGAKPAPGGEDAPADLQAESEKWRETIIEAAAEQIDEILEKYLEGEELTADEIAAGLRRGIVAGQIFPVLVGSAITTVGISPLLDAIAQVFPSPADRGPVTARTNSGEEVSLEPKGDAALSVLVFKLISEPHLGELAFLRVYSGTIIAGSEVANTTKDGSERIGTLLVMQGKDRSEVKKLVAGDIGAVAKLKKTESGDTIATANEPVVLPGIDFPQPVIQEAIEAKSKGDEDKISNGLARLHEEDPTFESLVDPDLKQTLINGMGELHLDVVIGRLKRKFGVEVEMIKPKIPYRETVKGTAEATYRHKKQTGGRGQFGEVAIRVQPRGRNEGFEFVNAISGGVIPARFIPGVEKGIVEAMADGVQAGCQVIDLQVTLFDGKFHPVDSSEMAFKIAGSMAFKRSFLDAAPSVLEPIYELTVKVPDEYMGDVIGDLSSRRGKILGMDSKKGKEVIKAMVPLAEMYRYSTHLRSMTQGRGSHSMTFRHYEEVPSDVAQIVIKEAAEAKEG